MSAIEQGKAVVKKISEIVGGLTRARGAADRAADEKTRIATDVGDVKSAGEEVAEGLSNLKSAGSKLDSDVKATAANVTADVAAVKGVTAPAAPKAGATPVPTSAPPTSAGPKAGSTAAGPGPAAAKTPAPKPVPKPETTKAAAPKPEATRAAAPKPAPSAPKKDTKA